VITVSDNVAPIWTTSSGSLNRTLYCGQTALFNAAQALGPVAIDNCTSALSPIKVAGSFVPNGSGGGSYTNTWTVADASGNTSSVFTQVITVLGISVDASASSNPVPVNSGTTLSATVAPAASGITVLFTVDNGNGTVKDYSGVTNSSGLATATVPAADIPVEVYLVTATAGNNCASSIAYLPVYDPNGGFVTGGGWINSPGGAYVASPLITGKANFGFNAKYKKGSNAVDGNTEFQFHAGNFNFKSSSNDAGTLVISGAKATYRGVGTVNGAGDYGFMVVAIDGAVSGGGGTDKFRIKIWNRSNGNAVVYDNQMGKADNADDATILGGGSIVIHQPAKRSSGKVDLPVTITSKELDVRVQNNPSTGASAFRLQLRSNDRVTPIALKVTDMTGKPLEAKQGLANGSTVELGRNYIQGMYMVEVVQGDQRKVIKLMKQ
jgi:hypothetical protein